MAEAILPDSSVIKVPDFALEVTQTQMLAVLKLLVKENNETQKLYEELIKETKDNNKDGKKTDTKNQQTLDKIEKLQKQASTGKNGTRQKIADRLEADVQGVFIGAARAVGGLATAVTIATTAVLGFGIKAFTGLTDNLRDLTLAGLGFSDSLGNSASRAIIEFNNLGYSTQEAAQTMMKFGALTATLGRSGGPGSLTGVIKRFAELTRNGADLGLGFRDSTEALLEELEGRSQLGMLENGLSEQQMAGARSQIRLQTAYASVLGISADRLRELNKQVLGQNTGLVTLMGRFGTKVYEGAAGFNTVMQASGENLGKLSQILLDASTMSSAYISEAARELSYAGFGELTRSMEEMQRGFATGTLAGTEAGAAMATKIQAQLANINQQQLDNLQRVVEAGGAGAEMAKLIILASADAKRVKQSMERVQKLLGGKMTVDDLMAARNNFQFALENIKTAFETLSNSLMVGFGPVLAKLAEAFNDGEDGARGITKALQQGIKKISDAILRLFGVADVDKMNTDELRNTLVKKIDSFTTSIAGFIDSLKKYVDQLPRDAEGNIQWKEAFKDIGLAITAGILSGIASAIVSLPGLLFDGLVATVKKMAGFSPSETQTYRDEIMGSIGSSILTIIGGLFAVGAMKSVIAVGLSALKKRILGEVAATAAQQGAASAAGNAAGAASAGAGAASTAGAGAAGASKMDAIAKSLKSLGSGIASLGVGVGRMLSAIGKGGGIAIASIFGGLSTGLTALGNKSVGKGILAMTALSVPVYLVGEAFKSWADVKWTDVLTGIGAIVGLGVVAGVIGNGFFVPVLLGAVAIGALGLALQAFPVDLIQALGDVLNTVVNTVMVNMPPIITAVGDALAKLVEVGAKGFDTIMNSVGTLLERISKLDAGALLESAGGIGAVGLALAGLGAGSVIGGIGNFFGSLFGGGDPFDRLLKVADSAPKFDQLTTSLTKLANVLGQTGDIIESLSVQPLESIVTEFSRLWKNLSKVELNNKQFQDFAGISTELLLGNAAAINEIAKANRAQNAAYAEFIKLDNVAFKKNVEAAFNYNKANKGETSETSITDTIKNLFRSLTGSPATPVVPGPVQSTNPSPTSTATPVTSANTPVQPVNRFNETELDVITDLRDKMKKAVELLEGIKNNG